MFFITSWDDGHPLDYRLAELLNKYRLKGTFFVPINNRDGRPVLSNSALRDLDSEFEIASHTRDHFNLTKLTRPECKQQIRDGKRELEQLLGHPVAGFCYPRGKWNYDVRQSVVESGCTYARTTQNLSVNEFDDKFSVPVTLQFFPHTKQTIIKNFIRHRNYERRFKCLVKILNSTNWFDALISLIDQEIDHGGVVHVWGHSWEIDENSLWKKLEILFRYISEKRPTICTLEEFTNRRK